MNRSLSRTLRGRAALDACLAYLAPASRDWGPSGKLPSAAQRNSYANHQAVKSFLAELGAKKARHVYLADGERLPLGHARFRPSKGDPDIDGDEGTFGFGNSRISLDGIRIRMSAQGVLEMADRWGDSAVFGTAADAAFEATLWETDEWDLPAAVQPVVVCGAQVTAFTPQITALVSHFFEVAPTDRISAEKAIHDHYKRTTGIYEVNGTGPIIRWCSSPAAALAAFRESGRMASGWTKSLRDSALFGFNQEIDVRLGDQVTSLRRQLGAAVAQAIGGDLDGMLADAIFEKAGHWAFARLGIGHDIELLAWYKLLEFNGIVLPADVHSFCEMTRSAWLLFPSDTVFAVERPTAIERNVDGIVLIFSDREKLIIRKR